MRVIGNILNQKNLDLIGFMFAVKPSGNKQSLSKEEYVAYSLASLSEGGFENRQVKIQDGRVIPKGNTDISKMRTFLYFESDKPVRHGKPEWPQTPGMPSNMWEVPNELEIKARILVNGELKGFDIDFGEGYIQQRVTYNTLIVLRNWLNPTNFVVRETANKKYIAGKPGITMEGFPEVEIGNKTQTPKSKRAATGGTDKKNHEIQTQEVKNSRSLTELLELVRKGNGIIIKMPNETYNSITKRDSKTGSDFTPLGIGEIGTPSIAFSETNLNANITFRKIGTVEIKLPGIPATQIYSYTWSKKSIFVDGENHLQRFGVGVTPEIEKEIIHRFGEQLITARINDTQITTPISAVMGRKDLVYFIVDASKLTLISEAEAHEHVRSTSKICRDAIELQMLKTHAKVARDCIKKFKEMYGGTENKQLYGLFAGMNQVWLDAVTDAGIDIYSGAYIKKEALTDEEKKDPKVAGENKESVKIEYQVVGGASALTKINYDSVLKGIKEEAAMPKGVDETLIKMVKYMEGVDPQHKVAKASEWLKTIEERQDKVRKDMWLHKVACFKLGNERGLAIPERKNWEEVATKAKNGRMYKCKKEGYENVKISMVGIDLV